MRAAFVVALLLAAGAHAQTWTAHTAGATSIAVAGEHIYSTGLDGALCDRGRVVAKRDYELYSVAVTPDGRRAALCGFTPNIDVIELESGRTVATAKLPEGWCLAVAFAPDGKTLAAGASVHGAALFDLDGKLLRRLDRKWSAPAVAWSPDGRTIAAASFDLDLVNAADGAKLRTMKGDREQLRSVAFSPDGAHIAAAGIGSVVHVWSVATGEPDGSFEPIGYLHWDDGKQNSEPEAVPTLAIAFSPDGKLLAAGGAGRMVHVYDFATGKPVVVLEGMRRSITGVAFRDNRTIAASSLDKAVRTWTLNR